jgi:SecD/SecF fusion protein
LVKKSIQFRILLILLNEVSDKQINKGLDLEGGINVIQISVKDILKGLSNNLKLFNKSLADVTVNQGNQTYIDAFLKL